MNYPSHSLVFLQLLCLFLSPLCFSLAEARIGESKSNLERRLFASGGIRYRDDAIIEARREDMPYEQFMLYLESDFEFEIYHKSATADKALRSKFTARRMLPGWDLHVIYINGKSAVEVYQRSTGMTEQEMNYLLLLQGDGKNWSKREVDSSEEDESLSLSDMDEEDISAFGYEMVRNDGVVRAKNQRNGILFVDAKWDIRFALEQDKERNAGAPISVNGF